jgi:hypothetical protein
VVQRMEPGRVLGGRYRIRSQVGSGRRVWTAYDEDLHEEVTVEEVGAADEVRTQSVAGSLRAAARRLRGHPYAISVHDVVEADGVVWAVVPSVAGPSLADLLAGGRMSTGETREIAMALLAALEAMHEAGVVHGDVRPVNIRLDHSRWVLLPGTGALAWADAETTRDDGESFAAADYSAPEILRGGPRRPSSDLFSLGATLYHLVAGHAPFHRDSGVATLAAVVMEEPPPLGHTGRLERLIEGLLVKDPERRLTVAEARRVLGRAEEETLGVCGAAVGVSTAGDAAGGRRAAVDPVGVVGWGLGVLLLAVAVALALGHVSASDISGFFVTLLPWVVFFLGVCVLAVQARAALARRRSPEVPLWRGYVRSLAPPAPWNEEEREWRRAAAERVVDEALLTVDRRVAAASPGTGRGPSDV